MIILHRPHLFPPVRLAVPALAAVLLMAIAVWSAGAWLVQARLVLGGIVYAGALAALGGLPAGLVRPSVTRRTP